MTEEGEKLAYLAGIIDGEGSIYIEYKKTQNELYRLVLEVGNTSWDLIEWLKRNFGGNVNDKHLADNGLGKRPQWQWRVYGYDGYKLLKQVRDYLVIKKQQADLAMEFWYRTKRMRGSGMKRPRWLVNREREYYIQMRKLNGNKLG